MNDKRKEYSRYAVRCQHVVTVTEDQDAGSIQQQMADGWIKFAEAVLRPLVPVK
jgi:hypothetical protein